MQTSFLAPMRGLTLIELLLAVSLCAVLLGAGIPGFRNLVYKNQRDNSTQRLSSLFALARSTAVKHNRITWICGSADGVTCQKTAIKAVLVFVDANNNHKAESTELIAREAVGDEAMRYQFTTSTLNSFRYRPDGTASSYGNVIYCPQNRDIHFAAKLIIANTGRLRLGRDRNGDGFIDGVGSSPIICP